MESKREIKQNEWLELLKMAIDEGVEIQMNHRFKYKNKNLGTFLTSAKTNNNVQLIKKIERLGIRFKMHSRKPEDYLAKFILQLSKDKKPNKQRYITRFNTCIIPKKDILNEKTIKKLNTVWKRKFGDIRKWEKPDTEIDKIRKWREFRYDEKINPSGNWFHYRRYMGKLYGWVYKRKTNPDLMNVILKYFNEKEIFELKKEGF